MKKKLLGIILTLLFIVGTITPSVSAVMSNPNKQVEQEQTTDNHSLSNSETPTVKTTESLTDSKLSEETTSSTQVISSTQKSNTEIENVERISINEQNFPDENFRNFLLKTIDNKNDKLLEEELNQITELNLSDLDIQTLEGIQYFKKLEKLEAQNNNLKELDVATLSALSYLDVSNNQLSKIDLSTNDAIHYFKGANQKRHVSSQLFDKTWIITDETLRPENDQVTLETPEWQYDGTSFTTLIQVPLNYIYHVKFSKKTTLIESSETTISVAVSVNFLQPEVTSVEKVESKNEITNLTVGDSLQLEYSVIPKDSVLQNPSWQSTDTTIVKVDNYGKITALKAGQTEVILSDEKKQLSVFKVIVSDPIEKESSGDKSIETKQSNSSVTTSPNLTYQTHVQTIGWQPPAVDGEIAGTTGQNKRVEGIKIFFNDTSISGNIEYSSHVQREGWQSYVKNGEVSGTTGQSLRVEAIRIRLTGELSQKYDIYYRVHSSFFGWMGWAKNNSEAGTSGFGYPMEAIQIKMIEKNGMGPEVGNAYHEQANMRTPNINYQTHIQSIGWQNWQSNNSISGSVGSGLRMEAIRMNLSGTTLSGGIEYSSHIQSIGWQTYVNNEEVSGTIGRKLRLEAIRIRLTGELSQYYDVYYRTHSAYLGWLGWAKNDLEAGSTGFAYSVEAIQIQLVVKGQSGPKLGTSYYEKDKLALPKVNYQTHIQTIGWQNPQANGSIAGTVSKGLRMEALRLNVTDTPLPGNIEYSSHVQSIGWQPYVANNEISGTTGNKLRVEGIRIRLTGQLELNYDVYYRVHSAKLGWLDWAKNDQYAGTSDLGLRMEAIQVVLVKKGASAPGKTDTPYQTSINHLFVMGHGVNDPGASYAGVNERDFTRRELMPYLQKWAGRLTKNKITFYNTNADMYQDSQRLQGAYTISSSFSSVSEFHLDGGAIGLSTGGHVIAHLNGNSLTPQNYAIANVIKNYVGLWGSVQNTGGINLRTDLLNMNVLQSRGIPYRLAELGFITNSRDVANIRKNIDQIAKGIVEAITDEKL
ncbi:hypothetical protein IGI47_001103 [Enterococcus sp. AZ191]|uniref:N-acetylmuramoyl-L-alanine amidase n=1 Tax=Enterococcus sp. AZ191 TaxID=2774639 RepID=UPI003F1F66CF